MSDATAVLMPSWIDDAAEHCDLCVNASLVDDGDNRELDDRVAEDRAAKVANEKAVTAPFLREIPKYATMAIAKRRLYEEGSKKSVVRLTVSHSHRCISLKRSFLLSST